METGLNVAFGTLLRRYRVAAGLTQEELAERAGVSRRNLGDLERGVGHTPRKDTIALLAGALTLAPPEQAAFAEAARRAGTGGPPAAAGVVRIVGTTVPFVGRGRELALLERHLSGEGPPLLLLAGEPGIGKSRLLHAARPRAVTVGLQVLEGGCQRRGAQEPYAPLLGALQRYLRSRQPVQLRTELQGCAWLVRLLPELAEGPIPRLPAWTLTPEQERRLMDEAVGRFLTNIAGPSGTLLVLDDLQWASPDALDLLATLVYQAPELSLRVLGAYRDTEIAAEDPLTTVLTDLAHARLLTRRLLSPLAPAEAAQLLDAALESVEDASAPQRAQIVQRTGGVPFFVLSWAQTLRLAQEDGGEVAEARVPWDVAQGTRQRLGLLAAGVRAVLDVAALVGRVARPQLLAAVLGCPEAEVLAALTLAERARVLVLEAHVYRFAHDVVREVVEEDMGAGPRRLLHRRIAAVLQAEAGERLVEEIAHHYARSDDTRAAAEWLERAGDRAVATLALKAALEHYRAAWDRRAAGAAAGAESRADSLAGLAEKMGDVSASLYQHAAAREQFAQARTLTTSALRRAVLWYKEAMAFRWDWDFARALEAFARAETEGRMADGETALPLSLRAAIALGRADVHRLQGQRAVRDAAVDEALRLYGAAGANDPPVEEVLRLRGATSETGALAPLAHALVQQGIGLADRDALDEGEEQCRRGLALSEAAGDPRGAAIALCFLAILAEARGHLAEADDFCQRSLRLFESCGAQYGPVACWGLLSVLAWQRGELARAEEDAQRSMAIAEGMGNTARAGGQAHLLGQVALLRGHLDQAEEDVRRTLAIGERWQMWSLMVGAWLDLGLVACARGDLREATLWCRAARRQAHLLGATVLEAEATLGLARARLLAGRLRWAASVLDYGRRLAGRRPQSRAAVHAALLAGEVHLRQGALAAAQEAAEEALRLASGQGRRPDEAVAYRLLGQVALAQGDTASAAAHLRRALAWQSAMGAALEAARTRVALAQALVENVGTGHLPDEADTLVGEARAQFAVSGAALDLAQAEWLAAVWASR